MGCLGCGGLLFVPLTLCLWLFPWGQALRHDDLDTFPGTWSLAQSELGREKAGVFRTEPGRAWLSLEGVCPAARREARSSASGVPSSWWETSRNTASESGGSG